MDETPLLILKIRVLSPPAKLYECLTTDKGREKFWVERSVESRGKISFLFPNGQKINSRIVSTIPGKYFEIEYFGSIVKFKIIAHPEEGCILELHNEGIVPRDWCEQYAGWVSVLMALKAYLEFGIDLRNHHPDYTWDEHFIDN